METLPSVFILTSAPASGPEDMRDMREMRTAKETSERAAPGAGLLLALRPQPRLRVSRGLRSLWGGWGRRRGDHLEGGTVSSCNLFTSNSFHLERAHFLWERESESESLFPAPPTGPASFLPPDEDVGEEDAEGRQSVKNGPLHRRACGRTHWLRDRTAEPGFSQPATGVSRTSRHSILCVVTAYAPVRSSQGRGFEAFIRFSRVSRTPKTKIRNQ